MFITTGRLGKVGKAMRKALGKAPQDLFFYTLLYCSSSALVRSLHTQVAAHCSTAAATGRGTGCHIAAPPGAGLSGFFTKNMCLL